VRGREGYARNGRSESRFPCITHGNVKFSVVAEIKTPDAHLLRGDKPIRSGAWSFSKELTDAVAVLQAYADQWDVDGARSRKNQPKLQGIHTLPPKGIIVIGSLSEFKDENGIDVLGKCRTFERFRRSLGNLEVMPFDELRERAAYIVEQQPVQGRLAHTLRLRQNVRPGSAGLFIPIAARGTETWSPILVSVPS